MLWKQVLLIFLLFAPSLPLPPVPATPLCTWEAEPVGRDLLPPLSGFQVGVAHGRLL